MGCGAHEGDEGPGGNWRGRPGVGPCDPTHLAIHHEPLLCEGAPGRHAGYGHQGRRHLGCPRLLLICEIETGIEAEDGTSKDGAALRKIDTIINTMAVFLQPSVEARMGIRISGRSKAMLHIAMESSEEEPVELSSPVLQINHGDEARDEGDEGHEGYEGHEEEGGRTRGRCTGDEEEGHEGHEGHEGQVRRKRSEEGHEGHDGNVSRNVSKKRPILPFVGFRVRVKPNI